MIVGNIGSKEEDLTPIQEYYQVSGIYLPPIFQRNGEGPVFIGVCLFTRGYPISIKKYLQPLYRGYSISIPQYFHWFPVTVRLLRSLRKTFLYCFYFYCCYYVYLRSSIINFLDDNEQNLICLMGQRRADGNLSMWASAWWYPSPRWGVSPVSLENVPFQENILFLCLCFGE